MLSLIRVIICHSLRTFIEEQTGPFMRIYRRVVENRDTIISFLEKVRDVDYHREITDVLQKVFYGEHTTILETNGKARNIGIHESEMGVFLENESPLREEYLNVILIFLDALTRKGS